MDYRFIKTFILTAKHSSFSRAGEELRIAQSAVSRQIRKLEESMSCQLLIRSPQKVQLTEAGRRLYERAVRFDEWTTGEFSDTPLTIRVGTIPGLLDSVLVPRITNFAGKAKVNFEIRADSHPVIAAMLGNGELDACLSHTALDGDNLVSKKLFTESLVLISKTSVRLEDLSDHCWIHMGTSQFLKRLCKNESPKYVKVNSMTAIIAFVRAGMGVAVVPDHVLKGDDEIWRLPLEFRGQIFLTFQNYEIWPERLREFWEALSKT